MMRTIAIVKGTGAYGSLRHMADGLAGGFTALGCPVEIIDLGRTGTLEIDLYRLDAVIATNGVGFTADGVLQKGLAGWNGPVWLYGSWIIPSITSIGSSRPPVQPPSVTNRAIDGSVSPVPIKSPWRVDRCSGPP